MRRELFKNENQEERVQRARAIVRALKRARTDAKVELEFSNPLELLIATVLAAQATDRTVNEVTRTLFKRYRAAQDYADANPAKLEEEIKPTGFYHQKAASIIGAARVLSERFGGKVPRTMEEMVTLPGVGRKTANIVLFNAYGIIEGIAVDTHVRRVSGRLALTSNTDPEKIEKDLMEIIPRGRWGSFPYLLIEHGRAVCTARKPNHEGCVLKDICPSAFKV